MLKKYLNKFTYSFNRVGYLVLKIYTFFIDIIIMILVIYQL